MMILLAWLHVVAAITWIGGMVFLSVVVLPVFRRGSFGADRRLLFQTLARRFRIVVWMTIVLLIVTGPLLVSSKTGTVEASEEWRSLLHVKVWLVAGLVLLTAVHDFWLGPFVGRLRRNGSDSSPADQLVVRLSVVVARSGLVLALAVLFIAVALART